MVKAISLFPLPRSLQATSCPTSLRTAPTSGGTVQNASFTCPEGLQRAGEKAMKTADLPEHTGGHAQRWATERTCSAHQHLQKKSVSQRGLEKIKATMTRKLQMCLQLQFCSMLKVRRKTAVQAGNRPCLKDLRASSH